MVNKQILEKIKDWLRANIKVGCENVLCTDLITDNKNLLKAIKNWEEKMKKFYIHNTEGQLVEIVDSVDKAFEFLDNEGSYIIKESEIKNES